VYYLTKAEQERLVEAIQAAYAVPFIHDITDYIWEAVFAYAKGIPLVDPLINIRRKLLYDVVDQSSKIGWSAKAIQKSLSLPTTFELVIQRADILKKGPLLGFGDLGINSPPQLLGEALLHHWYQKVETDATIQDVKEKRVCILLKSYNRRRYVYFEENLARYNADNLQWQWTDSSRTGLQGIRKADGAMVFRWYPNQKQFFERFELTEDAFTFELEPLRLPADDMVGLLLSRLRHLNN
jgi:hypothetical protein